MPCPERELPGACFLRGVLLVVLITSLLATPSLRAQEKPLDSTPSTTQGTTTPKKKKIDGPTKARVFAALAGIIIFGLGIVALAWLGGRMTQRMLKTHAERQQQYLTAEQLSRDDWADKPLTLEERQKILARRT